MNVLVVDDEKEIADLVEVILNEEGYTVYKFYDAEEAEKAALTLPVDLAILDVMMPKTDGFTLCSRIRGTHTYPIIMLTAKIEDSDKIRGLSTGADDYITKPFNPLELSARIKAQLRRYTRYNAGQTERAGYEYDGLVVDPYSYTCTLFDEPVPLTAKEFKVLWLLCENAGDVLSSEQIYESVWGERFLDSSNTVMVHIRRIREKLKEPARKPRYIKTVWGVGYKIEGKSSR